jgi:hypothetical protein
MSIAREVWIKWSLFANVPFGEMNRSYSCVSITWQRGNTLSAMLQKFTTVCHRVKQAANLHLTETIQLKKQICDPHVRTCVVIIIQFTLNKV